MSTADQNDRDDLFDFPEAFWVDSFGFDEKPEFAPGDIASTPTNGSSELFGDVLEIDPVPNPPQPEGISDLEYDLFDFDSASNAPAPQTSGISPFDTVSEGLRADDAPEAPSSIEVGSPVFQSDPEPIADSAAGSAPEQPAAEQAAALATEPAEQESKEAVAATGSMSLLGDRGPRITLPEDMPGASSWERNRSLLALVGCFLLINTGIFFLAQQASDRFNQTISEATGLMAQVLLDQQSQDAQAAAPANAEPSVEHVIEPDPTQSGPNQSGPNQADPAQSGPGEPNPGELTQQGPKRLDPKALAAVKEPAVDPLEYDNTHQLGVARAKALLDQGKPEEARMLLNFVLANRDRVPMPNSLREEIDYLIPFTYFEQGSLIAPEEAR